MEENKDILEQVGAAEEPHAEVAAQGKFDRLTREEASVRKLTGMYKNWFLDYASYVILERAVPHIEDGLKPVQRRILHAMKSVDDGRYNKVANIVGQTMQYHPHGDASIKDAMVQIGQKELLIDCQGNWGNILTGDEAAAARYIEARLSKFALDVVFNKKTTEWMLSYDGRKEEPVTLPIKFPLLLAQGSDGIAVGLASKILPHNFNELITAAIAHLEGREFQLYPDFPTGGLADVSRYNDGLRGGAVKVRARISKIDKRTLAITEIPFTTTTESIKESIEKAIAKGKIKVRRVDDNTADRVEIIVQVSPDESSDRTIDALYAFTDCEVSIAPNACVISDSKPHFLGVKELLRRSADHTKYLLGRELEIRMEELNAAWHAASLEKIFIENRLYQLMEGCKSREEAYAVVDKGLEPFKKKLRREVTLEDVQRLTELKFIRITRYDSEKADNEIKQIEEEIKQTRHHLDHLTEYAVAYYERIREKYGKGRERKTELREFDSIEASKVAVNNAKLYVDRAEGYFGIDSKKMKDTEYVCDCSDLDDVIAFTKDGRYIIKRVTDKFFFEKGIYHIGIFKRNDERTIYNILYRDGKNGPILMKRCAIKGITRDKVYDITKGTPKSEIIYMSVNPNGEAEVLKVYFKPRPRLKRVIVDLDFSELAIKGRQSQGNLFSRYGIHKIVLKERGTSTLGGQNIWFDEDVRRLNADGRGKLLGEFKGDDKIVVWTSKNQYYITGFDLLQHFPDDTVLVARYDPSKVYSVCYFDRAQGYCYMKRFQTELTDKMQNFLEDADLICVTDVAGAKLEITFKGAQAQRPADEVDVDEFVGVKSHRAKGKRLTNYEVASLRFIEPELPPVEEVTEEAAGDVAEPVIDMEEIVDIDTESPSAGESDGVEFEIERPRGDLDDMVDPEQLILF